MRHNFGPTNKVKRIIIFTEIPLLACLCSSAESVIRWQIIATIANKC